MPARAGCLETSDAKRTQAASEAFEEIAPDVRTVAIAEALEISELAKCCTGRNQGAIHVHRASSTVWPPLD